MEKLTQDINGLKYKNSEKDQQWERPNLDDFEENRDSLCFQQIEAEDGSLPGGKTTIRLFGVTEVFTPPVKFYLRLTKSDRSLGSAPCD